MNKWLKKITPTSKSINKSGSLSGLKSYFKSDYFWSYEQQPVARGIAAGLAGAVLPGFQILYAAILAIILRGNLPVALLCTLITNPLTVVPITYFIYYIGTLIVGDGHQNYVIRHFKLDFSSFHAFWTNISAWILQFGKAFFVGLPIVSFCLGVIGYFVTTIIWNLYLMIFKRSHA